MVNRVIDHWIPAEFRCISREGNVFAIYSGRVCEETNRAIIILNGCEFGLLLSTRQKAEVRNQLNVMRNYDIIELSIYGERRHE